MFDKLKAWVHNRRKVPPQDMPEGEQADPVASGRRYLQDAKNLGDELADICEELIDATYQVEDQRLEYETLGKYFDDITRIEQMPEQMRRELNDIAAKLELLAQNQAEFKQLRGKLSEERFEMIARYEQDIPEVMRSLAQMEMRDEAIRRDMKHLENEKEMQDYVMEEAEEKQRYFRRLGISIAVMGILAFVLVFWMYQIYIFPLELVCMIVLFVITLLYVVLYLRYRGETYEIKLAQVKKQKAITLQNKVKLKYVNSNTTLDYIYRKYQVSSLRELEHLWEEYHTLQRETRKFQNSLGDMQYYYTQLERVLREANVINASVWLSRTSALLDEREMVEVKHSLNTGRQQVRAAMEENEQRRLRCLAAMKEMVIKEPARMEEIREVLATYHIAF